MYSLNTEAAAESHQMEFTLRYRGPLPAVTTRDRRVPEKHEIREHLHKQLEKYWQDTPMLREMFADLKGLQIAKRAHNSFVVDRPLQDSTKLFWRWPLCGYDFVPLVTQTMECHCELNIRFYRKSQGILYSGGDIDNRLKTFLDALQVPQNQSEIPSNPSAPANPSDWPPLFCLLDNDRLVTKLTIESFRLLEDAPEDHADRQNYAELDVDVKINPVTPMQGTVPFLFRG